MCPLCNSTENTFLGTLGKKEWYRCQCCGIDYYEETWVDIKMEQSKERKLEREFENDS